MIRTRILEREFKRLRQKMVEDQLRTRGIEDERVLTAMSKVPRHQFVDSFWEELAYSDRPLPIAHKQTISQPYIVAWGKTSEAVTRGNLA